MLGRVKSWPHWLDFNHLVTMKFLIFLHETLALTAMLLVMFRTGAVNKISIQVARKIKLPIRHFRTEKKTGAS